MVYRRGEYRRRKPEVVSVRDQALLGYLGGVG